MKEYMGFKSTILVVEDVIKSRKLYEDILHCKVTDDFDKYNVGFEEGFALYKKSFFSEITNQDNIVLKANNLAVYPEFDDIEAFEIKIKAMNFELIHQIMEQPWGQNIFDYDGYMI